MSGRRSRIGAVAAVSATAAMAGAAPAAAQTWSAPQRVAVERTAQFSSLRLAVGPDGRGLLVWASRRPEYAIRAVDVAPDGTLGPVRRISPLGDRASGPQVGVGRGGEAVVGWRSGSSRNRSVRVAVRAAGAASFGAPVRLSPLLGRSLLTGLDVGPDGRAVAAWVRRTGSGWRVQVAERAPGGAFGPARTVSGAGAGAASVAVAGDSSAVVVWSRVGASRRSVVEAVSAAPGGAFGAPQRLSGAGDAFAPRVAVDAAGAALISWAEIAGRTQRLRAAMRPAASAPFGAAATVASASGLRGGFSEAEVALAAGRAYAAWSDFGADPPAVRVATAGLDGAWSGGTRVSDLRSAAFTPEVRAAGDRAVVIWDDTPQDGGPRFGHLAAAVGRGGAWSAPQTISDPALILQTATSPRLAMAPDGTALAAYVDYGFEEGSGRGQLSIVRLPAG